MTKTPDNSNKVLETMIAYHGEASGVPTEFDLKLFKQLNEEYRDRPVVPAPRPMSINYGLEIGQRRGTMLDRKIGITGQRVLELGCGAGAMSRVLAKDFDCETVGVDIGVYEEWEPPLEGNLQLRLHDVTRHDNAVLGQFDRVISFAVFEHVVHPFAAMQAVYDMLKPGGKAYIYANLYRGAKASHRYREVYFPWPHLLFEGSVWREFYRELTGEPDEPAWVNKLTYDQYVNMVDRIGFNLLDHFPSAPYFNEEFYNRFDYQLAAYPIFDLKHDFIHMILEKPGVAVPDEASSGAASVAVDAQSSILAFPAQKPDEDLKKYADRFWEIAEKEQPDWTVYKDEWTASRMAGADALSCQSVPTIPYPAISFLKSHLNDESQIFEWSSGGSTFFFQSQGGNVISIEHDKKRYSEIKAKLTELMEMPPAYWLVEPDKDGDQAYASQDKSYKSLSFECYVRSIEAFDDTSFDLVFVDGRARMSCLVDAVRKVASGGVLFLNQAQASQYAEDLTNFRKSYVRGWEEFLLDGPVPYEPTPCWGAIAWRRPKFAQQVTEEASSGLLDVDVTSLRAKISALPLRPYDQISYLPIEMTAECADLAVAGKAFELANITFQFAPDFDWDAENELRSKRLFLHAWDAFEPVFAGYSASKDVRYLDFLLQVTSTWIDSYCDVQAQQQMSAAETSFVFADTAISNRFYRLAYLICASAGQGHITDETFKALLISLKQHAHYLSLDENFSAQHNHGMYQALAQICGVTRLMGPLEDNIFDTHQVHAQGMERLKQTIEQHISTDGIHKDHSASYHILIANALSWVVEHDITKDPAVIEAQEMMTKTASWMYDGEGEFANLGDSDLQPALPDAQRYIDSRPSNGIIQGLFRDAGYWFVKGRQATGMSYLAQTANFHSRAHKQADTGSFLWRDRGHDILVDTGRYGYVGRTDIGSDLFKDGFWYSDPRRVYVESTRAHNTVQVDEKNHPRFRQPPFGSGLRDSVRKSGVVASESTIPNLPGLTHNRILALRPGEWLLCIDTLRAGVGKTHDIKQNFHLHPDWKPQSNDANGLRFQNGATDLYVTSLSEGATISQVANGVGAPDDCTQLELAGWWSPRHLEFEPCPMFSASQSGNFVTIATLFSFHPATADMDFSGFNVTRRRLRFKWKSGGKAETVVFTREIKEGGAVKLVLS